MEVLWGESLNFQDGLSGRRRFRTHALFSASLLARRPDGHVKQRWPEEGWERQAGSREGRQRAGLRLGRVQCADGAGAIRSRRGSGCPGVRNAVDEAAEWCAARLQNVGLPTPTGQQRLRLLRARDAPRPE